MKRKVGGGWLFIILIPIGMVISFYLYDFGQKVYFSNKLEKNTKTIFTEMMNIEGLETNELKKEFLKTEFEKLGYKEDIISYSLAYEDDNTIIFTYRKYESIVGSLSFGILSSKDKMVSCSYIGYYNDYKEAIIEEYDEEI